MGNGSDMRSLFPRHPCNLPHEHRFSSTTWDSDKKWQQGNSQGAHPRSPRAP